MRRGNRRETSEFHNHAAKLQSETFGFVSSLLLLIVFVFHLLSRNLPAKPRTNKSTSLKMGQTEQTDAALLTFSL